MNIHRVNRIKSAIKKIHHGKANKISQRGH